MILKVPSTQTVSDPAPSHGARGAVPVLYARGRWKLYGKHGLCLRAARVKRPLILRFLSQRHDWTCGVLSGSRIHRLQLRTGCCIRDHINNTRRILYIRLQHQPSGHSTFVSIAGTVVSACEMFMATYFSLCVDGVPWKCTCGACAPHTDLNRPEV